MKENATLILLLLVQCFTSFAQTDQPVLPAKVSHAEPIYFDLIRDLGARKGERELNVGIGMANHATDAEYSYLVEYEFAPVNKLGMEIEIPLSFHRRSGSDSPVETHNGIEGIKAATQYSFFVSEKLRTTMAAGYIFERCFASSSPMNVHTPFVVVAKRWGAQFHTMLYAGPVFERDRKSGITKRAMINGSIHYMLPGTKNFVGLEINDEHDKRNDAVTFRPQVKMTLSPCSSLGLSLGIAGAQTEKPLDFLVRWIFEPRKKN
jgi:hypothetical protein